MDELLLTKPLDNEVGVLLSLFPTGLGEALLLRGAIATTKGNAEPRLRIGFISDSLLRIKLAEVGKLNGLLLINRALLVWLIVKFSSTLTKINSKLTLD